MIRMITAGLVGFATCTAAMAQGSFNIDDIPGIDQAPTVSVDLSPTLLGFLRGAAEEANPGAPDLFAGLHSIKLRVYHASDNSSAFSSFIQDVAGRLEGQGWQRVASVQGEGSNVQFHAQLTEDVVNGMTIMVLDDSEAIFINIEGSITAAELGRLAARFGVPELMGAIPSDAFPALRPPAANDGN